MGRILAVTMTDVARAAGVCQATVSLALRKHPSIPEATRQRIDETVRRLGYRPHGAISALMAGIRARRPAVQRATLGAVTSWAMRDAASGRAEFIGARRRARELGYALEEFRWEGPGTALDGQLARQEIEGIVIFPLAAPGSIALAWENYAAAAVGYTLEEPSLHRAATAHYDAVIIALRELRERGYRRVGLVLEAAANELIERKWLAAFSVFQFETAHCDPRSVLLVESAGRSAFARWCREYRPDSIVCGGAVPVRRWLRELGWRVPGDAALVTLNASPERRALAGVDERPELVGAAAVDLVVEQLHRGERGVPADAREVFITGGWVEGRSVRRRPGANSR